MLELADRWRSVTDGAMEWDPPAVPTVVVVPHPDDEVLGAGGLIARQRRRGLPVTILAVTDGEAAYPGVEPGSRLRRRRVREQEAAARCLGVGASRIRRLRLPDGVVSDHERGLADRIAEHCTRAGLVVAPWTGDHHCDHEAVGRAAVAAADRTGVVLVQSLFWTWLRREPADLFAEPVLRHQLDVGLRSRRFLALARHESQLAHTGGEPTLGRDELAPMAWDAEYFLGPIFPGSVR